MLTGGTRFGHLTWWGHGIEVIKETFGVKWLPTASSVLTRFWNKISTLALSERLGEKARKLACHIVHHEGIPEDNLNLVFYWRKIENGIEVAEFGFKQKRQQ